MACVRSASASQTPMTALAKTKETTQPLAKKLKQDSALQPKLKENAHKVMANFGCHSGSMCMSVQNDNNLTGTACVQQQ
jgi:hypothetical protein